MRKRIGDDDHPDLFQWADARPQAAPPEPAPVVEIVPRLSTTPAPCQIINRVTFFRQRKRAILAIFFADKKALLRPVSGEVIFPSQFQERPRPEVVEDEGERASA